MNNSIYSSTDDSNALMFLINASRLILGTPYDRKMNTQESHNLHRPVCITAIPGNDNFATHAVVGLPGSPCRGQALVALRASLSDSRDLTSGRRLTPNQESTLRNLITMAAGVPRHMVPWDFKWESPHLPNDAGFTLPPRRPSNQPVAAQQETVQI